MEQQQQQPPPQADVSRLRSDLCGLYQMNQTLLTRIEALMKESVVYYDYDLRGAKEVPSPSSVAVVTQGPGNLLAQTTSRADPEQDDGNLNASIKELLWAAHEPSQAQLRPMTSDRSFVSNLRRVNEQLLADADQTEGRDVGEEEGWAEKLTNVYDKMVLVQLGLNRVEKEIMNKRLLLISPADEQRMASHVRDAIKENTVKFVLRRPPATSAFAESSILSGALAEKLEEWYGSDWRILYRASQHGWRGSDFHSRCDDKGPTLTVIRSTSGGIFGGFLLESWRSDDSYIACTQASLFTLIGSIHGIAPARFPVRDPSRAAVGHSAGWGPVFGCDECDLAIGSNANSSQSSYSSFPQNYSDTSRRRKKANGLTGTQYFQVAEIEVFRRVARCS